MVWVCSVLPVEKTPRVRGKLLCTNCVKSWTISHCHRKKYTHAPPDHPKSIRAPLFEKVTSSIKKGILTNRTVSHHLRYFVLLPISHSLKTERKKLILKNDGTGKHGSIKIFFGEWQWGLYKSFCTYWYFRFTFLINDRSSIKMLFSWNQESSVETPNYTLKPTSKFNISQKRREEARPGHETRQKRFLNNQARAQ